MHGSELQRTSVKWFADDLSCRVLSNQNMRLLLTAVVVCVAGTGTAVRALHYANFVRALVPWGWLLFTVQESPSEDSERGGRVYNYQRHVFRPLHKEYTLSGPQEVLTDNPFEFDVSVPQNLLKRGVPAAQRVKREDKIADVQRSIQDRGREVTAPQVSAEHHRVDVVRTDPAPWQLSLIHI